MNEKDLMHALGDIDEDLIVGAFNPPKRKIHFLPLAAAACLCAAALILFPHLIPMAGKSAEPESRDLTNFQIAAEAIPEPESVSEESEIFFSFTLSWDGNTYSSESQILKDEDGAICLLSLPDEALNTVRDILSSGLSSSGNWCSVQWKLGDQSFSAQLSKEDPAALSLIDLLKNNIPEQ